MAGYTIELGIDPIELGISLIQGHQPEMPDSVKLLLRDAIYP